MSPVTTVCLLLVVLSALGAHAGNVPLVPGRVSAASNNSKAIADNGGTTGNNDSVIVVGSSGPSRDGASVSGHNQENGNRDSSSSSIRLSRQGN